MDSSANTSGDGPSPPTDNLTSSLVARLRQSDSEAVALLDNLYRTKLVRFCWGYLGTMDEAEDAVQEVWHNVLRNQTIPDHFRPWLYKIARNHCLNVLRRRARRKDGLALPAPSQLAASLTGHLTGLVNEERQQRLLELVRALPPEHSEILRLRYVEELSRAEIAQVLEKTEPQVKSRLYASMKTLREQAERLDEP